MGEDVGSVILLNKFTETLFAATTEMFKQQLDLSAPSCTAGLVVVVHSLIMLFGSLQNILNGPLIGWSSGQALLTFFPIQQCLHIYSRRW